MSDDYAGTGVPTFGPPMIECDHFGRMIIEGECTICSGRDKAERDARNVIERRFTARFDGHCGACGQPTLAGEPLALTGDGRYLCEDCAP